MTNQKTNQKVSNHFYFYDALAFNWNLNIAEGEVGYIMASDESDILPMDSDKGVAEVFTIVDYLTWGMSAGFEAEAVPEDLNMILQGQPRLFSL